MYNKLFTKILDSSIWLESTPTRIVWITFIAAMDEEGFCSFAAAENVAARARVTIEEAMKALHDLESPDRIAPDQENEGRRIERVPGGWIVLNAGKYRDIITREHAKAANRRRVANFREKKKNSNGDVTLRNAVTITEQECNAPVMQSGAVAVAVAGAEGKRPPRTPAHFPSLAEALKPAHEEPDDFNQDPEANIPEGMAMVQYACLVLQVNSIPAGFSLKLKTSEAIEMLAKDEGCSIVEATKRLIDRMRNAGPQKWNFWLQDGGWKQDAGMDATERAFLYGVPDD